MTLFQKDFNVDTMLAGGKTTYDDIPKHKLKQLLMSRDEEISTNLVSQLHDLRRLEKSDRLLEMAKRKLKKLNKEIKSIKEEWSTATHKIATENSELHNEIKELKTNRQDAHTEHHRREQDWYSSYMIKKGDIDKLQAENKELKEKLKKLKKEKEFFEKEFHFTLDCQVKEGDQYEEEIDKLREVILDLNQQLRASHEVSAVHIKRATELTSTEREIDKVCSRIQTPDDLGHLMGNTEIKELKEQIEINSKLYKSLEKSNEMKVKTLQTEIKCMELRHDYTMEWTDYYMGCDTVHHWREFIEEKAHKQGTWDEIMVFFDD